MKKKQLHVSFHPNTVGKTGNKDMWTKVSQAAVLLVRLGLQCYNLWVYISWETEFRKVLLVRLIIIAIYRFSSEQRLTVHLVTYICENQDFWDCCMKSSTADKSLSRSHDCKEKHEQFKGKVKTLVVKTSYFTGTILFWCSPKNI